MDLEAQRIKLKDEVKALAVSALMAVNKDQFKRHRDDMLKKLTRLSYDFNDSSLLMDKNVRDVRLEGHEKELESMRLRVAKEMTKCAMELEMGDNSRLDAIKVLIERCLQMENMERWS